MPQNLLPLIPVILALAPAFIVLAINSKSDFRKWLIALIAGGGWFVALIARLPFLTLTTKWFQGNYVFIALSSSILAGVFEEPVRFVLLKYVSRKLSWELENLSHLV